MSVYSAGNIGVFYDSPQASFLDPLAPSKVQSTALAAIASDLDSRDTPPIPEKRPPSPPFLPTGHTESHLIDLGNFKTHFFTRPTSRQRMQTRRTVIQELIMIPKTLSSKYLNRHISQAVSEPRPLQVHMLPIQKSNLSVQEKTTSVARQISSEPHKLNVKLSKKAIFEKVPAEFDSEDCCETP